MRTYIFDVFQDDVFFERVSVRANNFDEAEDLAVQQYGDEIELVEITKA